MNRACIAIVDATRARVYTYEHDTNDPTRALREVVDLVNPQRRLRPSELFSDSGPGSERAIGDRGHGFDDHREAHLEDMDDKFARDVVHELDRVAHAGTYPHVIVVASPKMLGGLRRHDGVLHRDGVVVDEIARDLAKLTSSQLHDRLADLQVLPPRQRPGARSAAR